MRLKVPLHLQDSGSLDCGLVSLRMILDYYGQPTTSETLKEELITDEIGTYAPQLGSYLLRRGFSVEIKTLHPALFTINDNDMAPEALRERFRLLLENHTDPQKQKVLRHFIAFLEHGGTIDVGVPTIDDVAEELAEKRPLCALMTTNLLKGSTPAFNFHIVVITGWEQGRIFVNDPLPGPLGGRQEHAEKEFFYALYASAYADLDNASLIKIRKL